MRPLVFSSAWHHEADARGWRIVAAHPTKWDGPAPDKNGGLARSGVNAFERIDRPCAYLVVGVVVTRVRRLGVIGVVMWLFRRNIWHTFAEQIALIRLRRSNTRCARQKCENCCGRPNSDNGNALQRPSTGHISSSVRIAACFRTASAAGCLGWPASPTIADHTLVRNHGIARVRPLNGKSFLSAG